MRIDPWLLVAPGELEAGGSLVLDDRESKHVTGSLRRQPGDQLVLTDGAGWVARGKIAACGRAGVVVEILDATQDPRDPHGGLTLGLSVLHGQAMDWAVQKAVEVGVLRLVPVVSDRSQLGLSVARGRQGHWRRVAVQALKQCHRSWAMEVEPPVRLADLVTDQGETAGFVADPAGETVDLVPVGGGAFLVVGPEGGFTAAERDLLTMRGWRPVRLGRHLLRAETAAVVGAALLIARMERP